MAKIVSRLSDEEIQHDRLRTVLEVITGGAIAPGGDLEPATDLAGLVDQVDIACASILEALEKSFSRNDALAIHVSILEGTLSKFTARFEEVNAARNTGARYDDALDHATIDTMEAMLATGAFESTFDGAIALSGGVTVTKEDFKPIVKQAIDTWLNQKIR